MARSAASCTDLSDALALRAAREAISPPMASVLSLREGWRRDAALGLGDAPLSGATVDAWAALLDGLPPYGEEIAAVLGCPRAVGDEVARLLVSRSGFARREPTRVADGDADCTSDRIRAGLPKAARGLADTCLDPDTGLFAGTLDVATVTRAEALASPAARIACLIHAVLFRRAEPAAPTLPVVADWEGVDELVQEGGFDPFDPEGTGSALGRYARGELLSEHPPARRRRVLGCIRTLRNLATAYRAEFREDGDVVLGLAPPLPVMGDADRMAVTRFRVDHALDCRRNRKAIARAITRDLDGGIAAALVAVSAARSLSDACLEAEREMRGRGRAGAFDFGYDAREVFPNGRWGDGLETTHMRGEWRRELRGRLEAGGAVQGLLLSDPLGGPAVDFDPAAEPIDFSFVSAESGGAWSGSHADGADAGAGAGDGAGAAAVEGTGRVPHVLRHFADGVFLSPAGLDEGLLARRLDRMVAERLPAPRYRPAGLMGPDGAEQAALHRDAANAGLVMVCPHALLHGLLFALACALAIVMSFARSGEVRQIIHDEAGWTVVGQGALAADAFWAVPKGQAERRRFRLAPLAMRALGVLVEFGLAREGLGEVPVCDPARDLDRRCGRGRFVFAFRGSVLSVADLNYLLAFLFAGVARVRTHDLRHAAAARASGEGATDEMIASWMNVRGWCVRAYATDEFADEADEPPADAELGYAEWASARTDAMVIAGALGGIAA